MAETSSDNHSDYVPEPTGTPEIPEVSSTQVDEQVTETSTAPVEPDWRESWSDFGDVTQFDSEDDWKSHLKQTYQAVPTLRQYAQYGEQFAPHQQEFYEFLAERGKPQKAEPEEVVDPVEKAFSDHWKAPEYNPQWEKAVQLGYIQQDENGTYVATNPMAAEDARKLNEYRDFERNQLREFARQGPKMLKPAMEALIEQKFQEYYQGQQQQQQDTQAANEVIQRNAGVFYQVDQNGQFVPNAMGQPQLTPIGERFYSYQQHYANQYGEKLSAGEIAAMAESQLRADVMQAAWAQQQAAANQTGNGNGQQQAAAKKTPAETFIERAEANASGGSSTASPPASPVKWKNDRDMAMTLARRAAAAQGVNIDE